MKDRVQVRIQHENTCRVQVYTFLRFNLDDAEWLHKRLANFSSVNVHDLFSFTSAFLMQLMGDSATGQFGVRAP